MSDTVFVAITMDSGETLKIMGFATRGKGNPLPFGAEWEVEALGLWKRAPSSLNISHEVSRACPPFGFADGVRVALPQPITFRVISEAELPSSDRTFRDACRDEGKVEVDMSKAREIHREHMRRVRERLWPAVDANLTRALVSSKAAVAKTAEAKRQALRDVTDDPCIAKAKTPEALKMVWPEELGDNPWR